MIPENWQGRSYTTVTSHYSRNCFYLWFFLILWLLRSHLKLQATQQISFKVRQTSLKLNQKISDCDSCRSATNHLKKCIFRLTILRPFLNKTHFRSCSGLSFSSLSNSLTGRGHHCRSRFWPTNTDWWVCAVNSSCVSVCCLWPRVGARNTFSSQQLLTRTVLQEKMQNKPRLEPSSCSRVEPHSPRQRQQNQTAAEVSRASVRNVINVCSSS